MSRPFRHTIILVLVGLGTALAAVGGWRYARASAPVNGPIILISIDTLRADHLPAYGYRGIETPAIDSLARDGVVFERAYSPAPLTLPAHVSLLTGRLPFDTGVRDNAGFQLKADERTLAEMLRDRGYATGAVVSSYVLRRESGIDRGFDFFDAAMAPGAPESAVTGLRRDGAQSEALAEQWLGQSNRSRALLLLHLYDPHRPYTHGERYTQYSAYDAEVAYADEVVGRLLAYLKAQQLYEQSTIILVSDHGEGLGDHGEQGHGLFLYDEAIHIPFIVKQAGGEGAGTRVGALVELVDVTPTILDLAKAPIPGNLRGRPLKPLLEGRSQSFPARVAYAESLYGQFHFGWSGLTAMTDGTHQFIRAPRPEMYDLGQDPREQRNLAAAGTPVPVASDFPLQLEALLKGVAVSWPAEVAPDVVDHLEALGYVGSAAAGLAPADPRDPKDMWAVLESERTAADLAVTRQWVKALAVLQQLVRDNPDTLDAWRRIGAIAFRAGRYEQAVAAQKQVAALTEADPQPHLASSEALLRLRKLDEARKEAKLAIDLAGESAAAAASAHDLLARIAFLRHDAETVRAEAAMARTADPGLPLPDYFEGRLLAEERHYDDALEAFKRATGDLGPAPHAREIPDLHYSAAETLRHLERDAEAEYELLEELKAFPQNTRAWSMLATLYRGAERTDEAEQAIAELLRVNPTPEGYAAAERLWTSFGQRQRAAALRTEASRQFDLH